MDSVALWMDEDDTAIERIQRKLIRDTSNIFNISNQSFIKNFRLSKDAFTYVLNEIEGDLKSATRSSSIPLHLKLAATLKLLGQGGYQHQIGQDRHLGISQPSISGCLKDVCAAITRKICPKHIAFEMSQEKQREAKRYFYNKCGIPGVIGAVDGTHIQIIAPTNDEHLFRNRKMKHSINAMAICNHEMYILAVNGRYCGSSHDSLVWNLSKEREYLKINYENGDTGTRILGDSGYPLEPWLLTPYRSAQENSAESNFNEQHSKGRCIIERAFGLLKARFRCLLSARELHYCPNRANVFLCVCVALHNICLQFRVEEPRELYDDEDEQYIGASNSNETSGLEENAAARTIRNEIRDNMFRNT